MKRTLLIAAFCLAAAPALAFQCPADMAEIDAAIAANPQISAADLEQAKVLRAEGEALHAAGNHQASVDTLAQAKALLGLQ